MVMRRSKKHLQCAREEPSQDGAEDEQETENEEEQEEQDL
jgi:hypothetical protein